jgi:hypothetical protein
MPMRKSMSVLAAFFLLALAVGATARAHEEFFAATMTNANEPANPPVIPTTSTGGPRPASFGNASFVLNDLQNAMTMSATVFNIDFTGAQTADTFDNLVAAHIHASSTVTPTTTAPVVWGFFGSPLNDNNPNDVVVSPFASGVGGTITAKWDLAEGNNTNLFDQLTNILNEKAYINFHTVQFGAGEVRGTLVAIPEPSALVLFGAGALVLTALSRGRRRALPR